jgi:hypothetical protein
MVIKRQILKMIYQIRKELDQVKRLIVIMNPIIQMEEMKEMKGSTRMRKIRNL